MNLRAKEPASHKAPRDFVYVDEFWAADDQWPQYYLDNKVWVFMDEYHADLAGDEDYARIIIHSSSTAGWLYSRRISERDQVHTTLDSITRPVSQAQLESLGFRVWTDFYI